ncbi:hypothetical protein TREES_T100012104 [Tupaia chinensis]|uniref:Uncharacterized protein n=1 Tax=Tupaia chinensis TaxID=246437 RepID=L9JZN8_TUPCH|nr:hypothetical protein TREES_T100012104 [Tupaia chinensis]
MAQRDAPLACTLSLRQTSGHPYFSHWQKAIGIMAAANPVLRHGLAHSAMPGPGKQALSHFQAGIIFGQRRTLCLQQQVLDGLSSVLASDI